MKPTPHSTFAARLAALRPTLRAALMLGAVAAATSTTNAWSAPEQPVTSLLAPAPVPTISVKAFVIDGQNPLSDDKTHAALQPFTGEVTSIERLRDAARALEGALKSNGFGFYRVNLPPQTVTDTVHLQLVLFTLGKVEIAGNRFVSVDTIRSDFPTLVQGQSPNTREVSRNVAMFNEQESKQVIITLMESATRDAIDASLEVKDSKPDAYFLTLQNNGNDQTGKYRTTLGYQNSYFLQTDQSLSASYTTSPSQVQDVKQVGVFWSMPLYRLASSVSAYAVYSDVNSGQVAGVFDVSGQGRFFGAKWTYQWLPVGDVTQNVALALDGKQYVNRVVFGGQNTGVDVTALPITLSYAGKLREAASVVDWHADIAANVPAGDNNNDASYTANRAGATPTWSALRFGANLSQEYAGQWMLQTRVSGQGSDSPLISGEQFGLGGTQTLRAYADREASGDSGYALASELWAPPLGSSVRMLGFVEAGSVRTLNVQAGQTDRTSLADWGIGLRWQLGGSASLSLDAAQALVDAANTKARDWRASLSVAVKF